MTPVLKRGLGYTIFCGASGLGYGRVLMQLGRVVAHTSQQLENHKKNYRTRDLELRSVMFVLKTWRHYL